MPKQRQKKKRSICIVTGLRAAKSLDSLVYTLTQPQAMLCCCKFLISRFKTKIHQAPPPVVAVRFENLLFF